MTAHSHKGIEDKDCLICFNGLHTQDTKCSKKGCNNECYKGETCEYDGRDYCSYECLPKQNE